MNFGLPEILLILLIVLLLFGPGRIKNILGELGGGLKAFKDGLGGQKEQKPEEKLKEEQPKKEE